MEQQQFSNFQNPDFSNPEIAPSFFPGVGYASTDQDIPPSFFSQPAVSPDIADERAKRYDYSLGGDSPGKDQLANEITVGDEDRTRVQRNQQDSLDLNYRRAALLNNAIKSLPADQVTPEKVAEIQAMDAREVAEAYKDPATFYERKFARAATQTAISDVTDYQDQNKEVHVMADKFTGPVANQQIARKLYEDALGSMPDRTYLQAAKEWVPFYRWTVLSTAYNDETTEKGLLLPNNMTQQIQAAYRLSPDEFQRTQSAVIADLKSRDPELAAQYAAALLGYTASDAFGDAFSNLLDLTLITPAEVYGLGKAGVALGKAVGRTPGNIISNIQLAQAASRMKGMAGDLAAGKINYIDLLPEARQAHEIAMENIRRKAANSGQAADWDELMKVIQPIHNPQSILEGGTNMTAEQAARLEVGLLQTARTTMDNLISRPRSLERLAPEELAAASSSAEDFVKSMYAQTTRGSRIVKIATDNLAAGDNLLNTDAVAIYYGNAEGSGYATQNAAKQQAKVLGIQQSTEEQINGKWYVKTHQFVNERDTTIQAMIKANAKYQDKTNRTFLSPFLSRVRMKDSLIPVQLAEDFKYTQAATNAYFGANQRQFIQDFNALKTRESKRSMDSFLERERDYRNQTSNTDVQRGRYAANVGEFEQRWMSELGRMPTFEETKTYFSWQTWNDVDYAVRNLDLTRDMARLGIQNHELKFLVPGQDGSFYTPKMEGKVLLSFPWERRGDAGILIWDINPQTENSVRKMWLQEDGGKAGKVTKEYIDDLVQNKGYVVLHLAPHSKARLADTMASWGGPTTQFIPPSTPLKVGAEVADTSKPFVPGINPDFVPNVPAEYLASYPNKVDALRKFLSRQSGNPEKTSYNLSSMLNPNTMEAFQLNSGKLHQELQNRINKGELQAFSDETGQEIKKLHQEHFELDTRHEYPDLVLKFKDKAPPISSPIEENYMKYLNKEPFTPSAEAAYKIKYSRQKAESAYHISKNAAEQPNPYAHFDDLLRDVTPEEGSLFQAHGISKGDVDQNLIDLLDHGITKDKTFHEGPVKPTDEQRATGILNTSTYGSPYVLLSDPGKTLAETGVKNIVLNRPGRDAKQILREFYPDVNFMTPTEAKSWIKREAKDYEVPTNEQAGIEQLMEESRPITGVGEHNIGDEVYRIKAEDQAELTKTGKLKAASSEGKITKFFQDKQYGTAAQLDNGSIVPTNELYKPGSTVTNKISTTKNRVEDIKGNPTYEVNIHDSQGNKLGWLDITEMNGGKLLKVRDIESLVAPSEKTKAARLANIEQNKAVNAIKPNIELGRDYLQKHVGSDALNGGVASLSDPTTAYGVLSHGTYTLKSGEKVIETVNGYKATGANEIALWRKQTNENVWYKIATVKKGSKGQLEHIVVAPEYQRQGIGEYLVKKAKSELSANPLTSVDYTEGGAALVKKTETKHLPDPKAGTLGAANVRGILDALKREFPDATEVTGFRVTGARQNTKKGSDFATTKLPKTVRSSEQEIRKGEPTYEPVKSAPEGPGIMKGWEIPNYDYIIVKPGQDMRTTNLNFMRFPRQQGGHKLTENAWQLRQPQIYTAKNEGAGYDKAVRNIYEGDKNVYSAVTEKDARDMHTHLENVRQMLDEDLANNTNHAENYYRQNLDGTSGDFQSFKKKFREFDKDGYLTTKHPFVVTPRDASSWDYIRGLQTREGKPVFQNLENMRDSDHNLFNNDLNLKFAMQRSDNLEEVVRKGTLQNPAFGTQTEGTLSPMATLINSTSQLIRGRVIDDLKFKTAENFAKSFAKVIDANIQDIRRDPYYYLLNAQWKTGLKGNDLIMLNTAKDYRRAAMDFLGVEDPGREYMLTLQRSTGEFIKRRLGQGSYDWVDRHLLRSGALAPVRWANNVVFDLFFGLFNIKQLAVQGLSSFHTAAVLGPVRGSQAGFMAWAARPLLYNDRPELMRYMANALGSIGIKKEWFEEGLTALKQSGWHIIGAENALQDDFINQSIKGSLVDRSRDVGRVMFKEGDRLTRNTAYMGAYLEWRTANPVAVLTPRIQKEILNRADTLSLNMTAASNAMIAKGAYAIPLKFTTYYARMAEQLLPGVGTLTAKEKMRAYAMYSVMFGAPITAGGVFGLWPLHKEWAKALMDRGYDTDENKVLQFFNGGLANLLPSLLGVNQNFSETLGPTGSDWLYDIYNGRSPLFDVVTGVAGTKLSDSFESAWPFFTFIANAFRSDENAYPLSWADLESLARTPSSVNNVWKAIQMYNTGVYATKSMTPLARGQDGVDALSTLIFGTEPSDVQKAFLQTDMIKATTDMKKSAQKDVLRYHRLQMKAVAEGDRDAAIQYGKELKYTIIKNGFQPNELNKLFSDAVSLNGDLVHLAQKNFDKSTVERQQQYMERIRAKQQTDVGNR